MKPETPSISVRLKPSFICRRALRTFDIGDMRAWVSRLRGVYEAGGGREYRVL